MANTKIIFFIPTLSVGGGERVASELSLNLPSSVETVFVLFKKQVSYPYKGKLICLDIPISINLFSRAYYFLIAIFRLKKVIKKENPDYVISFGLPANIINILSGKKAIIRIDTFLSSSCSGFYKILAKLFFKKASRIICVSKKSAEDLVKNFGVKANKIKVIYNPLDVEGIERLALKPLEPEYQKIFDKPVIINIGRLTKEKNQYRLIKVFKEVKKVIKQAQLVILGTGELRSELEEMIKDLGLENDVHLLGWQENPFKFLAKSKIFVSVSSREGLPYAILEAMACGLPIISTDCESGPREILAPKTDINQKAKDIEYAQYGILIPVIKNEEALKQATIEILKDRKIANKLAEKSKQRAGDFNVKKIIKEWNHLDKSHKNVILI